VIGERIVNGLSTDYPADRFKFVVASDGSSDATSEIVRGATDPRVRLFDFADRRGKARVLNDVVPQIESEIIVLSDANTFVESGAVRRMVRWLSDPAVGVVVGRL